MKLSEINRLKSMTIMILLVVFMQVFSAPEWFSKIVIERRGKLSTSNEFTESLWNDILTFSKQYFLDPVFVTAVIAVESNFVNTKGPGGVIGYMQILPSTAKGIAKLLEFETPKEGFETMLWNQKKNIQYGTAYLSYLYKKTGTLKGALMSYNNGPKKEQYAENVLKLYNKYSEFAKAEEKNQTVEKVESSESLFKVITSTSTDTNSDIIPEATYTNNETRESE